MVIMFPAVQPASAQPDASVVFQISATEDYVREQMRLEAVDHAGLLLDDLGYGVDDLLRERKAAARLGL